VSLWGVALLATLSALTACSGRADHKTGGAHVGMFTNPVYQSNFPDPGVIRVDGVYYAYGTNGPRGNIPMLTSTDLVHWTEKDDVLPQVGSWAQPGNTWAPEVLRTAEGRFVLYYTARSTDTGRQCIGRAVADRPTGPFADDSSAPLVCQAEQGGSIDASPFTDADGSQYLHWKNDGNAIGKPTHLFAQRLSSDGLRLLGEPVILLTNTEPWQGHVIEAPQMVRHDGRYFLFYSGNAYDSDAYAVGYALCDTPLGPCHDAPENPILRTTEAAHGPGHSYVIDGPDGNTWILYHAWPPGAVGSVVPGRLLWADRVDWKDGRPVIHGPTSTAQPVP
jgi:beta-xylosidase